MKTIICPVDNSSITANAVAYAKHLSVNLDCRFVQFRKQYMHNLFRSSQFAFLTHASYKDSGFQYVHPQNTNRQTLADNGEPVMQMQSVCAIATAAQAHESDLIVAGTESDFGFNDLYTETIAILVKQAKCPLLLIPEGVTYKPIRNIVVVMEHESYITHRIDFLLTFASIYEAQISFLQITSEDNNHASTRFLESWREMYLGFPYQNTAFCEAAHSCVPKAIREFVKQAKADLIVVVPNLLAAEPYSYTNSYQHNEQVKEPLTVPLLAIDSLLMPSLDLLTSYYN